MTAPCTRAAAAEGARVGEAGLAELLDDDAHVESCAECRAALADYRRLTGALAELAAGARRRPDHVARALAAAAATTTTATGDGAPTTTTGGAPRVGGSRRSVLVAAPLMALAAGIALVWWLRRGPAPQEAPPRFAFEVVAQKGRPVLRGDAQLGDILRVTAPAGSAAWIYRNDRELLLVCPRDCRREGARLTGEVALDAIGRYQLVWLSTDRIPPPTGELELDVASARAAGASHELRDLEVQ